MCVCVITIISLYYHSSFKTFGEKKKNNLLKIGYMDDTNTLLWFFWLFASFASLANFIKSVRLMPSDLFYRLKNKFGNASSYVCEVSREVI